MKDVSSWRQWGRSAWNDALFDHYFVAKGAETDPVTRIVVTPDRLRAVTGDLGADALEVQDAFLNAVRVRRREFIRAMSAACLDENGEWREATPPPFIANLILTCLAAAGTGDQVLKEGDFRKRLRRLLRHPILSQYNLPELPRLWRALAAWLGRHRHAGSPFRELVLPDPGWMKQIGYSVGLTFPNRRDQLRLARLLSAQSFDAEPPVPEVVQLVQAGLDGFGESFLGAFEKFRSAFVGGTRDLSRFPFWSTVRDAVRAQLDASRLEDRCTFRMVMETNDDFETELVLLATGRGRTESPAEILGTGAARDDERVVCVSNDTATAVVWLLDGRLPALLPDLLRSPVRAAAEQGVLLFQADERGTRALCTSRPREGEVFPVVRHDIAQSVCRALGVRLESRQQPIDGWYELPALPEAELTSLVNSVPALATVRCLQQTARGIVVQLLGGVLVEGGILGIPEALPAVRVEGATDVTCYEIGKASQQRMALERCPEEQGIFRFPVLEQGISGRYSIVASKGELLVAQRNVAFRTDVVSSNFRSPKAASDWLVEGAGPADTEPSLHSTDGMVCEPAAIPRTRGQQEQGLLVRRAKNSTVTISDSIDCDFDNDRLIELFAALSNRRAGISEGEFLEHLKRRLLSEEIPLWDVVRSWLEAGYFERLSRRRWRGRVYFARPPAFVVSGNVATLSGLAPRFLRQRVDNAMAEHGGRALRTCFVTRYVPPLQRWRVESREAVDAVAAATGVEYVWELDPNLGRFWSIHSVFDECGPEPVHYAVFGKWSWAAGCFSRFVSSTSENEQELAVEWLRRPDRPDFFRILRGGQTIWWSYSRNWALLVAMSITGRTAYERYQSTSLRRITPASVFLPLPVARHIVFSSGLVAGPVHEGASRSSYIYDAGCPTLALDVIDQLTGAFQSTPSRTQLRWLLSLLKRQGGRRQPVPNHLRVALRKLPQPEARELATSQIPPWMIPQLQKVLEESS